MNNFFNILKPGPISGIGPHTEFHGSSSDDADDPSSRGSSRPNSTHEEEVCQSFLLFVKLLYLIPIITIAITNWLRENFVSFAIPCPS